MRTADWDAFKDAIRCPLSCRYLHLALAIVGICGSAGSFVVISYRVLASSQGGGEWTLRLTTVAAIRLMKRDAARPWFLLKSSAYSMNIQHG